MFLMKTAHFILNILIVLALTACGDAPLWVTPLPNGYALHSNGGAYGYIKNSDGLMLAEYFGKQNNGRETWCTEFSWKDDVVICRLINLREVDPSLAEFFVFDTVTREITVLPDQQSAQDFWSARYNLNLPLLYLRHASTTHERYGRSQFLAK